MNTSAFLSQPIIMVGCGNMGHALLAGFINHVEDPSLITIIGRTMSSVIPLKEQYGVTITDADNLPPHIDNALFLFCLKPQILDTELERYKHFFNATGSCAVSVAAGKTLAFYESSLGSTTPIIRAMPNLPSTIGQGITGLIANRHASQAQQELAATLFNSVGTSLWLDKEADMDPLTAVAGSGPAYIFHVIEALIEAGISQGLSAEVSKQLALHTVSGSANLALKSSFNATELRKQVTSPNGTTAAGLEPLMHNNALSSLFDLAVRSATRRSKELAQ